MRVWMPAALVVVTTGCQPLLGGASKEAEDTAAEICSWAADLDGDGFAGTEEVEGDCADAEELPEGDCDDGDAGVHPGADELCDEVDQDCDGELDEDAIDMATWYPDEDGDSFGDSEGDTVEACTEPEGYTARGGDCNDRDARYNPNAEERCDEVDNDCDGTIDVEPAEGGVSAWRDVDGDGWGDASELAEVCEGAAGWTDRPGDCDDTNGFDVPTEAWPDDDGDGYGADDGGLASCDGVPDGYAGEAGDCDDGDPSRNPGADEVCDELDQDCDDEVDEDPVDGTAAFTDADGDGYGDPATETSTCELASGQVEIADDCDDTDATISPAAEELCNGLDDDCDGTDDEEATDAATWHRDSDGDGYGDASIATEQCSQPTGWVADATDCDDGDATISPGAAEACDGVDQDCDGDLDDGFDDTDGDGVADCVDDCPVYVDTSGVDGDGSESSPYGSIASGFALRGGSCDEVVLLPGTYSEQVDFAGEPVTLRSRDGYDSVVLDDNSAWDTLVVFESGEGADSVLSDVSITAYEGTAVSIDGGGPILQRVHISGTRGTILATDSTTTVTDSVLVNPAGVFSHSGTDASTFVNCVFVSAFSPFSGSSTGTLTVTNSIVYGGAMVIVPSSVDWTYNVVWENSDSTGFSASVVGIDGNLEVDPDFVGDGTYALNPTSPLIDAGTDTSGYGSTTDLGGTSRPQGKAHDIGAWEQ